MTDLTTTGDTFTRAAGTFQRSPLPKSDHQYGFHPAINVGTAERWGSLAAGGGLVLVGLAKRSTGGLLLAAIGGSLVYRGWQGHCYAYESLGISTAERHEATGVPAQSGFKIERTIAINRPRAELFEFWQNLENLPNVMSHIQSVTVQPGDGTQSHWIADGAFGRTVEWDAEIINIREGEVIAWRSLPDSQVDTAGSVHFESLPNDRGTTMRVSMKYNPPAGKLGASIASLFGDGLEQKLDEDLRRLKQHLEAGEIATTDGQPHGPA